MRNMEQASVVKKEIESSTGCDSDAISIVQLDLGNLDTVQSCAATLAKSFPKIDILINNGGISLNTSKVCMYFLPKIVFCRWQIVAEIL